ncbi:MAG: hypothetical protein KAX49_20680 [Halanaerobiales bacterium]|nr:hypothetical protein [Halanaerobiales bacterium]
MSLTKGTDYEGNTVFIIEHSLEMIYNVDWIIDLEPHGGRDGGKVIFEGTPMEIMECEYSCTGRYLKSFVNIRAKHQIFMRQ